MMDKRPRILVVEDDESARGRVAAVLRREDVRVETCGSLADASALIDIIRFDVALIDIMLGGPHDRANRDGVEVLTRIRAAGEGTKTYMLSGQSDPELVADIWQERGADGYLSKDKVSREGPTYYLKKIREALDALQLPAQARDWSALARALAPEVSEAELVHDLLRGAAFSGGLPVLRSMLFDAVKWLVPLLPARDAASRGLRAASPGVFRGTYWSKGQGCAVELILRGTNAEAGDPDPGSGPSPEFLHQHTKGGLTVAVVALPERARAEFGSG
jgi:CheY-like chemotaxis protein